MYFTIMTLTGQHQAKIYLCLKHSKDT